MSLPRLIGASGNGTVNLYVKEDGAAKDDLADSTFSSDADKSANFVTVGENQEATDSLKSDSGSEADGKVKLDNNKATLNAASGTVEVYAHSGGGYDVIVVKEKAAVVSDAVAGDGKVQIDGKDWASDSLKAGDVVIYTATDTKIVTVELAKSVTGTMSSYAADSSNNISAYTIGDKSYGLAAERVSSFNLDSSSVGPYLGAEYTYYLNGFDDIVYATSNGEAAEEHETLYALITKTNVYTIKNRLTGVTTDGAAEVIAVLSNGTSDVYELHTSISGGKLYYGSTNINDSGETALDGTLKDKVFECYIDEDGYLVLVGEALEDMTGSEENDCVVCDKDKSSIELVSGSKANLTYTSQGGSKTVVFNNETAFVQYDDDGAKAVVSGINNISGSQEELTSGNKVVVRHTGDAASGTYTAVCVFTKTELTTLAPAATGKYVYLVGTYTSRVVEGVTVYDYDVWTSDGEKTTTRYDNTSGHTAGIYNVQSDGTLSDASGDATKASSKKEVKTISGTTVQIDTGTYLTVNDQTKIVDVSGKHAGGLADSNFNKIGIKIKAAGAAFIF